MTDVTKDFNHFFKLASLKVREFEKFIKKNKKVLDQYDDLVQEFIQAKFVLAELGREVYPEVLSHKKSKVVKEDKVIEVRVGRGECNVFNKSIYKN